MVLKVTDGEEVKFIIMVGERIFDKVVKMEG